jgi:hypothetical protein
LGLRQAGYPPPGLEPYTGPFQSSGGAMWAGGGHPVVPAHLGAPAGTGGIQLWPSAGVRPQQQLQPWQQQQLQPLPSALPERQVVPPLPHSAAYQQQQLPPAGFVPVLPLEDSPISQSMQDVRDPRLQGAAAREQQQHAGFGHSFGTAHTYAAQAPLTRDSAPQYSMQPGTGHKQQQEQHRHKQQQPTVVHGAEGRHVCTLCKKYPGTKVRAACELIQLIGLSGELTNFRKHGPGSTSESVVCTICG